MRRFKITDKYCGNSGVAVQVVNYRWTRNTGLMCEMWPGQWFKSDYTLKEFLTGKAGHFREVTPDARYTITREWTGAPAPRFVTRFCGEWVSAHETLEAAEQAAIIHYDQQPYNRERNQ